MLRANTMRTRLIVLAVLGAGCGDDGPQTVIDASPDAPEAKCEAMPATGTFNRRAGNPRLLPKQTSTDGKIDLAISDPDVRWDAMTSQYVLYYQTPRGTSFTDSFSYAPAIRRATSADRMTWTVDDAPIFTVGDVGAWIARTSQHRLSSTTQPHRRIGVT